MLQHWELLSAVSRIGRRISGGLFIRPLIKRCHSYKLIVTIALHVIAVATALALFQLSVPERATIEPTHGAALWFTPRQVLSALAWSSV